MPQCFQQFEPCWAEGNYPMAGSKVPDFGGWCRFILSCIQIAKMKLADLFGLMDVAIPGVYQCLKPPCTCKLINLADYLFAADCSSSTGLVQIQSSD